MDKLSIAFKVLLFSFILWGEPHSTFGAARLCSTIRPKGLNSSQPARLLTPEGLRKVVSPPGSNPEAEGTFLLKIETVPWVKKEIEMKRPQESPPPQKKRNWVPIHERNPEIKRALMRLTGKLSEMIAPKDLAAIEEFNLHGMNVGSLRAGDLNGFINLKNFDASSARITFIEKTVFNDAPKIERVDISGNNLRFVDLMGVFDPLQGLKFVTLFNCNLHTVGEGLFSKNHQVIDIDLSGNRLSFFDDGALQGPQRLQSLDVSYNYFVHFNTKAFTQVPQLITFNAIGNPYLRPISPQVLKAILQLRSLQLDNYAKIGNSPWRLWWAHRRSLLENVAAP